VLSEVFVVLAPWSRMFIDRRIKLESQRVRVGRSKRKSLCDLSELFASVVTLPRERRHHRDTEHTEDARRSFGPQARKRSTKIHEITPTTFRVRSRDLVDRGPCQNLGQKRELLVLLFLVLFLNCLREPNVSAAHIPGSDPTGFMERGTVDPQDQTIDFSKFYHNNTNHARLPCLLCHRREGTAAKPTLPGAGGHLPCTGCHAKEFANSSSPVCTICHTNTQSGALKSFPGLKSFNVKFDHAIHVSGRGVSCSTCHRPSRGAAMTIPAGFSAHTTCYGCHAPKAQANGRDISSCGTCHELGGHARTPTQAAAFRVGFSHEKHGAPQKLSCNECHNVRAGMPQRRQVTAPLALNHHAPVGTRSCATCHTGKRAFGGDDFSVCTRCHRGPQWRF
jgi:c(7)-type cytochrome triheme protein